MKPDTVVGGRVGVGGPLFPLLTARSKPSCLGHRTMQGPREQVSPISVYGVLLRDKSVGQWNRRPIEGWTPFPLNVEGFASASLGGCASLLARDTCQRRH